MKASNPLQDGPTIVVTAMGEAEGSRGAAAALACAAADADVAALLLDVGGTAPRQALLASAAAQELEERLMAHLDGKAAARGQVCHLSVPGTPEGLATASAAATVARGAPAVIHVPPELLQLVLSGDAGLRPSAVLLRADLADDRPLAALAVHDLVARGFAVGVLKQRLGWVAERRALFGALPAGSAGGLPRRLVRRLGVAQYG